jgi:hypothetical protein
MTPNEAKLVRERMAQQRFVPADGPIENHSIHALNYIAFYLGELDQKMERIAKALEGIQTRPAFSKFESYQAALSSL